MMIRVAVCCLVLVAGIQHSAVAEEGWTSLFNGKTLDGWSRVGLGKAEYVVRDGTIYGKTVEGSRNTFLGSEKEYGDFELEFEVKVHDKLNSGVQIRSREKTKADTGQQKKGKRKKPNHNESPGRFFGPQVEIEASPGQSGCIYGEATGRGWLSKEPQDNSYSHQLMKNGQWNHFRIVAKGPRIQTWINGQQVADLTDEEIYKSHPRGKIGLQVHGIQAGTGPYDVAWRNIRIKEL
jgi:hypothetical protein